jgi:short-subunit dehydrogenase
MSAVKARVVITGASSGIGAALAREYARRGAILGLIARRHDPLARLAQELGTECAVYAADVRDRYAMRAASEDFRVRFGGADIVIGNAGVSAGTLTEQPADHPVFQEILDINVVGLFNTFQPFLPAMRKAASGVLVGVASIAGFRGLPGAGAYSASKAAAIAYLESLRVELRGSGVDVVTICPGYIATPMTERNPYAMPFLLQPEDAARRMIRAIDRRRRRTVVPWQMGLVGAVLRAMPDAWYDYLFARAPRKPRRAEQ